MTLQFVGNVRKCLEFLLKRSRKLIKRPKSFDHVRFGWFHHDLLCSPISPPDLDDMVA